MKIYKIEKGVITKDGHTMFSEDIIKDLNYWRNKSKQFQKEIKELQEELKKNIPNNWLHPIMAECLEKEVYTTKDIENILLKIRKNQDEIFKNRFGMKT